MSSPQKIDRYARDLSRTTRDAVCQSAALTAGQRVEILRRDYPDPDKLRKIAAAIKQHTIDHLDTYLESAVSELEKRGVHVHFAASAASARTIAGTILRDHRVRRVVKSKSMVTEEIELNPYLEEIGIECVETDLGEFIVQIDEDHPSHIIRPIIHKRREEVAESFEQHGLGEYCDDPQVITRRARRYLRHAFLNSDAGITGANFVSAESGRMVLVTNEGNARFSMAANNLHLAITGIEKIVPKDRDLTVFLNLLGRSATAQQLTVYTQFINGPRAPDQPHGPEHMHLIFVDNGRSEILAGDCREILRCIRCGACQNICPVYRQASGHAYRAVYGGPVGAVLSPLLSGPAQFEQFADLPKASSLCGACREVCPVDIPIPDMLLKLRNRAREEGLGGGGTPPMQPFAALATSPALWKTMLRGGRTLNFLPLASVPATPLHRWAQNHTLEPWKGGQFRKWLKKRAKSRLKSIHE